MSLLFSKPVGLAGAVLAWVVLANLMIGCGSTNTGISISTENDAGVSIDTAIKVGSIGEQLNIINGTSCGEGGLFRKTHVEVVDISGKHYDIVDSVCTSGGSNRKFYFDVSSCFPCPD